jgi:hypothetical protein
MYNGNNLLVLAEQDMTSQALEESLHDHTCPCLCVYCSGEYQRIKERHFLRPTPGTSYLEILHAITKESDAWTLRRKQEEGRK